MIPMTTFAHTTRSKPLSNHGNLNVCANHSQFGRFLCGGAVNTAATYALFVGLSFALTSQVAYTISYIAGIGFSYLINTFLVFRARASLRSAIQFPVVYLVQYILGLIVLTLLTRMELDSRLAMLLVITLNVPVTYVLTRFVIKGADRRVT